MRRHSYMGPVACAAAVMLASACATSRADTNAASRAPGRVVTDTARGSLAPAEALVELDVGATHEMGIYLSEVAGRPLYALTAGDPSAPAMCGGECMAQFEPVLGRAIIGSEYSGVIAAMVGTTTRADGTTQLTYNGRPLFRFRGDRGITDTSGHGRQVGGVTARLVHPNGELVR